MQRRKTQKARGTIVCCSTVLLAALIGLCGAPFFALFDATQFSQFVTETKEPTLPKVLSITEILNACADSLLFGTNGSSDQRIGNDTVGDIGDIGDSQSSLLENHETYLDWVLRTLYPERYTEPSFEALPASSVRLDVPLVNQFPSAPTGCEIASLTMLLLYAGYDTTFEQSLDEMWYSDNPFEGFVGDPRAWSGWTIYPEAAGAWIAERIGSCRNLTDVSLEELCNVLREGKPIVVWMIHPTVGAHCLCMTGFDEDGFYFNDPYDVKDWFCAYELFDIYWTWYSRMALSY